MIEINIHKSQRRQPDEVESLVVKIEKEIASFYILEEAADHFEKEAILLEEALHNVLPGGTYSRLLEKMLRRRANHFVVSFKD